MNEPKPIQEVKPTRKNRHILLVGVLLAFAVYSFALFCDVDENLCTVGVAYVNYCWMVKVAVWLMFPLLAAVALMEESGDVK